MSSINLTTLLRYFFESGLDAIPVVDKEPQPENIEGFLSRRLLDRELSDLDRAKPESEVIPPHLLISSPEEQSLLLLEKAPSIPVLNVRGEKVGQWDHSELYRSIARSREKVKEEISGEEERPEADEKSSVEPVEKDDEQSWLARLLLSAFPNPLYCCDIGGNCLFYNDAFERDVLDTDVLSNRIRIAEKYFFEIARDLLAGTVIKERPPTGMDILRASIPELGYTVEIVTLKTKTGSAVGYLFNFKVIFIENIASEAESLIESGLPLTDLLDDMESRIIYHMLERNGHNVSHSAAAMGLRRTTLQNRMKRLNIDEKFGRRVEGPIRRKKTAREESPQKTAESPQIKSSRKKSAGSPRKTSVKKTTVHKKGAGKASKPSKKSSAKKTQKKSH